MSNFSVNSASQSIAVLPRKEVKTFLRVGIPLLLLTGGVLVAGASVIWAVRTISHKKSHPQPRPQLPDDNLKAYQDNPNQFLGRASQEQIIALITDRRDQ